MPMLKTVGVSAMAAVLVAVVAQLLVVGTPIWARMTIITVDDENFGHALLPVAAAFNAARSKGSALIEVSHSNLANAAGASASCVHAPIAPPSLTDSPHSTPSYLLPPAPPAPNAAQHLRRLRTILMGGHVLSIADNSRAADAEPAVLLYQGGVITPLKSARASAPLPLDQAFSHYLTKPMEGQFAMVAALAAVAGVRRSREQAGMLGGGGPSPPPALKKEDVNQATRLALLAAYNQQGEVDESQIATARGYLAFLVDIGFVDQTGPDNPNTGTHPIHVVTWKRDVDMVKRILRSTPGLAANPFIVDRDERAPLHYAAALGTSWEIVEYRRWMTTPVLGPEMMGPLVDGGHPASDMAGTMFARRSELMRRYAALDAKLVDALVEAGAAIDARDVYGATPLLAAAWAGSVSAVEALLAAGADVHAATWPAATTRGGQTALHVAAARGMNEVVEALLAAGADSTTPDGYGRGALAHVDELNSELRTMLEKAGGATDATDTIPPASSSPFPSAPSSDCQIARVDARALEGGIDMQLFDQHFASLRKPVLLVGEFERWLKEPWSIDRLAEKHTNETSFGLVYPHLYGQLDTVSGMAQETTMADFRQYVFERVMMSEEERAADPDPAVSWDGHYHPPYHSPQPHLAPRPHHHHHHYRRHQYIFDREVYPREPSMWNDMAMPDFLGVPQMPAQIQFSAGTNGSGAHPHYHETAFNGLASGTKHWRLFAPRDAFFGRMSGRQFEEEFAEEASNGRTCVQRAGDLLYLPNGWGHALLNEGPETAGIAVQYDHMALDFSMPPSEPDWDMVPYLQAMATGGAADAVPAEAGGEGGHEAAPWVGPADRDADSSTCSIDVRPELSLGEFQQRFAGKRPVIFRRRGPNDEGAAAAFASASERAALLRAGPDMLLIARIANQYVSKEMSLSDFITAVVDPGAAENSLENATMAAGVDERQLYFLGDVIHGKAQKWNALMNKYTPPEMVVRLNGGQVRRRPSFGIAGNATGAPWHKHGPGFAEVVHGEKKWWFLPPSVTPPGVVRGQAVGEWLAEVLPELPQGQRPIACTAGPGDIVYVPDGWYHATLNLGRYNAYVSTFTGDDGHGGSFGKSASGVSE